MTMHPNDREDGSKRTEPDDFLEEVKRSRGARDVVNVEEERVKIVVFRCGANLFALYGANVREILQDRTIYPVPFLPDHLPGLINVRGDIESVADIRGFLGEERKDSGKRLIAMVHQGGFRSGVLVDSVEDVVDVPVSAIKPPLSTIKGPVREIAAGIIEWNQKTATLLDIEKLAAMVSL